MSDDRQLNMAAVLQQMAALQQQTAEVLADLKGSGGNTTLIEQLLKQQEQLLVKTRPENTEHPGISAFSYPEGDLARPKPPLKCTMFWVGYQLTPETLTPLEVDLLNRLEPGEFRVTKTDGTKIPFTVKAKHNDKFELDELAISFPCKGENRHNHGSMASYLQQALGDRIPSTEELMQEVQRLQRELEMAKSVAA